jgi:hypothetical protein
MTKDPDLIPEFNGDDEQLLSALKHMLTRGNLTITDKVVIKRAAELIEELEDYIYETFGHV